MTEEQILKKAIEKAVKNGYFRYGIKEIGVERVSTAGLRKALGATKKECPDGYNLYLILDDAKGGAKLNNIAPQTIIFSHDFAKAFWGEKERVGGEASYSNIVSHTAFPKNYNEKCPICKSELCNPEFHEHCERWQYHLQQMVLEKNPIKYLEGFLDTKEERK